MQLTQKHSFEFEEQRSLIFFEDRYGLWMLPATKNDIENYIRINGEEDVDYVWVYNEDQDNYSKRIQRGPWAVVPEDKLQEWLPAFVEEHVQQSEEVEE